MTYKELYESAADKLEKSKITLGEFEKMIEPLNAEIDTDSDTISRAKAIEALKQQAETMSEWSNRYAEQRKGILTAVNIVEDLPSAQPDIIRCRNCKFASGDSRICMKFGHSPIGELDFCAWAERRTDEQTKD